MRTYEQLTDAFVALESYEAMSSREALLDIRSGIKHLIEKLREFGQEVEHALIVNMDRHGDIDLGDGKRLYVGEDKSYKCRDPQATFAAVLEATGGDESLMCEHLASGAWKPGACRKTLGSRFDELFETHVAADIKTGSSKRLVKMHDPKFAGGGA